MKYIIQAYCTGMGFVDTKYCADSEREAQKLELALLQDDSAWLSENRETRIRIDFDNKVTA